MAVLTTLSVIYELGRPVAEKCPRCGGYMIIKGNKIACADEQCGYVTDKKPEREE